LIQEVCDAFSYIYNSIVTKLEYYLMLIIREVSSEERLDGEYKKNLLFSKQVFIFGGS